MNKICTIHKNSLIWRYLMLNKGIDKKLLTYCNDCTTMYLQIFTKKKRKVVSNMIMTMNNKRHKQYGNYVNRVEIILLPNQFII